MKSVKQIGQAPNVLRIQPSAANVGNFRAYRYQLIWRGDLVKIKLGGRAAGIRRCDLDAWVNTQAGQEAMYDSNIGAVAPGFGHVQSRSKYRFSSVCI